MLLLRACCRAAGNQKCRRKETWERLQRRHADRRMTAKHAEPAAVSVAAMWAPEEHNGGSDGTAAASTAGRPSRPDRLPLTSDRHLEKIVYELPSPTTVSLNGSGRGGGDDDDSGDVPPELASYKSSSAPHLVQKHCAQTLPRTKYYDGPEVGDGYDLCRIIYFRVTGRNICLGTFSPRPLSVWLRPLLQNKKLYP